MSEPKELAKKLADLKGEHRGLDQAIGDLVAAPDCDYLEVQRLKKRKLVLKDQIVPNIHPPQEQATSGHHRLGDAAADGAADRWSAAPARAHPICR